MSDEDTAVLLTTEKKYTEKEILIDSKQETYQNITQNVHLTRSQSFLSSVSTLLSGIVFGYDLGVASNIIRPMNSILNLTCTEHFYAVSCWVFGVLLSTMCGGFIIDIVGRRGSITLSMIMLFISYILMSLPDLTSLLQVFLISRLISGFAGPLSAVSQCIYISEISEPENRGFRISLHQFGMAFGGLAACIPVYILDHDSGWPRLLMQIIGFHTCWVIYITLYWLPPWQSQLKSGRKKPDNYRIKIIIESIGLAVFLVHFQLLCGRYIVMNFASRLYSLLGVCTSYAIKISTTISSVMKVLATGLCLLFVDRLGRRISLILSSTVMMICLSLLALLASIDDAEMFQYFNHDNCVYMSRFNFTTSNLETWRPENPDAPWALPKSPPPYPMLPTPLSLVSSPSESCPESEVVSSLSPTLRIVGILTVILYQFANTLGNCTVTFSLLTEIFPASIKGRCICAITLFYWIDVGVPSMYEKLESTISSAFLVHSFICMLAIMITYIAVPETKDKTLQQVAQELHNISLGPRMYENLYSLPFVGNCQWLKKRMQNLTSNGSTII